MINLTLAALIAGLTYTGSTLGNSIIEDNHDFLIGNYGIVAIETSTTDYSLDELYNEGASFTFDLRDTDRVPNFISVTFGYDQTNSNYLVNLNVNYAINFDLSFEIVCGTFKYNEYLIPLYASEGTFRQITIPGSYSTYHFEIDLYYIYVSPEALGQYNSGYTEGYANGKADGYNQGKNDGYQQGLQEGKEQGYTDGYRNGKTDGYQEGYQDGYDYADNQDATALVIFEGIISIGLLPINFFLAMLNFEVFGINIGGAVSAILTIAIVVIIIRIVVSGGNGGGKE